MHLIEFGSRSVEEGDPGLSSHSEGDGFMKAITVSREENDD